MLRCRASEFYDAITRAHERTIPAHLHSSTSYSCGKNIGKTFSKRVWLGAIAENTKRIKQLEKNVSSVVDHIQNTTNTVVNNITEAEAYSSDEYDEEETPSMSPSTPEVTENGYVPNNQTTQYQFQQPDQFYPDFELSTINATSFRGLLEDNSTFMLGNTFATANLLPDTETFEQPKTKSELLDELFGDLTSNETVDFIATALAVAEVDLPTSFNPVSPQPVVQPVPVFHPIPQIQPQIQIQREPETQVQPEPEIQPEPQVDPEPEPQPEQQPEAPEQQPDTQPQIPEPLPEESTPQEPITTPEPEPESESTEPTTPSNQPRDVFDIVTAAIKTKSEEDTEPTVPKQTKTQKIEDIKSTIASLKSVLKTKEPKLKPEPEPEPEPKIEIKPEPEADIDSMLDFNMDCNGDEDFDMFGDDELDTDPMFADDAPPRLLVPFKSATPPAAVQEKKQKSVALPKPSSSDDPPSSASSIHTKSMKSTKKVITKITGRFSHTGNYIYKISIFLKLNPSCFFFSDSVYKHRDCT